MKLPALKGSALAIFVALLIAGCPLSREELILYTGWERDSVTKGIKRLGVLGAIIDRGRYKGWELAPNWQQLPLPILYLGEDSGKAIFSPSLSEKSPSPVTRSTTLLTTTTTDQDVAVVNAHEVKAEKPSSPPESPVKAWLEKGGVGENSSQMRELLKAGLDEEYVKAHVLERLAKVNAGDERFGVGLLIVKLKAGDAAPPMRCEECLKVERECLCHGQYIPPELRGIIKQ